MSRTPLILHVCSSDTVGGAAIAAKRLVSAQREAGLDARMLVVRKNGGEDWIEQIENRSAHSRARVQRALIRRILAVMPGHRDGMSSLGLFGVGIGRAIAARRPAIVHLHWLGAEVVSLSDLAGIEVPAVWTCHDQWAFCGVEHYARDEGYRDGYASRSPFDPDRVNFRRKSALWKAWQPTLICPSEWMRKTASQSALAAAWPAVTIANTLDTTIFAPANRAECRSALGIPPLSRAVLFGADHGTKDPRKGFDLLKSALRQFDKSEKARTLLVTFGGARPTSGEVEGVSVRGLGSVSDERQLARIYNAADVFVAPSRQDNLPNTLLEAQACGTPCAGFRIGGLEDIVSAPHHGRLAEPFDCSALATAIMESSDLQDRAAIRADAVARFGGDVIAARHLEVYARLHADFRHVHG